MQDASFAEAAAVRSAPGLSVGTRVAMIVLGYIPLLHVAATIAVLFMPFSWPARIAAALSVLFVLPPLVARAARLREGRFRPGEPGFLRWWLTNQLQTLFNRVALEELLRLIPGLYSMWLRLWGASVGSLVYWSPRVAVFDRSLLRIGNGVVVGAGARLASHLLTREANGEMQLLVATITIEHRAVVGGWALLAPGARVSEGESLPAAMGLPPFRVWRGGRRLPGQNAF